MSILEPKFVEVLPPMLEEGVLYISMAFNSVVHNCACGCGVRVVTPLSPAGWQLQYDGRSVTLYPSIGNHQYGCRSHYWICRNRVEWSYACTHEEIDKSRAATCGDLAAEYGESRVDAASAGGPTDEKEALEPTAWWNRLKARLR